jgi:TPR repeat protein
LFIKGCELGASRSCYNAGLTYWSGHKAPIRPDLALQWFAKGCDLKSASSCAGAALAKLSAKSEQRELAIAEASRWLDQARYLDPGNPLVQAIGDWLKDGGDPAAAPVIPSSSPALATGS